MHILRFSLADSTYGVAIERVLEIAGRVLLTPLPDVPSFVEGVFSYRQSPCVAVSLRRRLGHAPRPPSLDEHLIIARGRRRRLGLIVDRVLGDERIADADIDAPTIPLKLVSGLVTLPDGLVLIHDIDALLDDEQEHALDVSLAQ